MGVEGGVGWRGGGGGVQHETNVFRFAGLL